VGSTICHSLFGGMDLFGDGDGGGGGRELSRMHTPPSASPYAAAVAAAAAAADSPWMLGRGLHSFPFQLNLSSPVHRMTHLNSRMCPRVAQVEL